jgi:hypothetical protein
MHPDPTPPVTDTGSAPGRAAPRTADNRYAPLDCDSCGKAFDAPACFWGDSGLDETWCEPCMVDELRERDDGRSGLDDYYWLNPHDCETCGRPMRGMPRGRGAVCSPACKRGLRAARRRRDLASPWELDCAVCGTRIEGTVYYGAPSAPSAPVCEPCFAAAWTTSDADMLEHYGRGGPFGMYAGTDRTFPGDDGYDPLAPRPFAAWQAVHDCGVCGRAVRGRGECCDRCDAQMDNIARRVEHEQRACEQCGEMFTPKRADARYHSDKCRQKAHRARVTANRATRVGDGPGADSRDGGAA